VVILFLLIRSFLEVGRKVEMDARKVEGYKILATFLGRQ